jgi:hypothetical protein
LLGEFANTLKVMRKMQFMKTLFIVIPELPYVFEPNRLKRPMD